MEIVSGHAMNLANSIIGVSILAMPYCFKQCGVILSVLLLLTSSAVSRLTCHYLLKSAIISRRKTFEFLAFHLFGNIGKLSIEIGMICFLLSTCVAYFVVMGDLGPLMISEVTKADVTNTMRTSILITLALFVVIPLGLLRNVHSLNNVSKATMVFYCCLVLRIIIEALPPLFDGNWYNEVNFWRPEGLLQCIPIFSMALFCQTQLFEIYEVVPNPTLDKMNILIRHAVNFCTSVYICVGLFGYIAFSNVPFTGNILLSFKSGFISHIMKVGFIFSVAFSFPLVIFPCRASLYSCLYKEGYSVHESSVNYIPEGKFKGLTLIIVSVSLTIGILIPNIEIVLSLAGSTIGVMICVLFPVSCFICLSSKNTNEKLLAQFLLILGIFVMVVGTYKNIHTVEHVDTISIGTSRPANQVEHILKIEPDVVKLPVTEHLEIESKLITIESKVKEIRHEPPQPVEPVEEELKVKIPLKVEQQMSPEQIEPILLPKPIELKENDTKNDQVDIEAIKKEDKEEMLEKSTELKERRHEDDHKVLIESIQKQNEVQKEIVKQQKQLLEVIKKQQKEEDENKLDIVKQEKMKAVKEIESIALKAIEKISEGEDTKKVVEDVKKGIEKSELRDKDFENLNEKTTVQTKYEKRNNKSVNNISVYSKKDKDIKGIENNVEGVELKVEDLSKTGSLKKIRHNSLENLESKNKQGELLAKRENIQDGQRDSIQKMNLNELKPEPILSQHEQNKNISLHLDKINEGIIPSKFIPLPIIMSQNLNKNSNKEAPPIINN